MTAGDVMHEYCSQVERLTTIQLWFHAHLGSRACIHCTARSRYQRSQRTKTEFRNTGITERNVSSYLPSKLCASLLLRYHCQIRCVGCEINVWLTIASRTKFQMLSRQINMFLARSVASRATTVHVTTQHILVQIVFPG
jgi:Zn ribbon nucleic-acid-binding protein